MSEALKAVAGIELIEAPGLAFSIPRDLQSLPRCEKELCECLCEKGREEKYPGEVQSTWSWSEFSLPLGWLVGRRLT